MSFPIALQLYSIREDLEEDLKGTLEKVKSMGYQGVELAGLYGLTPEDFKSALGAFDLKPVSAHVPFIDMIADPEKVMSDYALIGCEYIVIPYLTEEYRPGEEKFNEVIEGARVLGEIANKHNLTLLYHNHDFEFTEIDGEYALDILYKELPAELLKAELDTCWVNVGGEDPATYIKKYSGRTPVVHLKDFMIAGKKPAKMYELIGIEEEEKESEEGAFEFRPLGMGLQDIPSILEASAASGAKWVVVEQDAPTPGKTSLECAQISIDYLKSL